MSLIQKIKAMRENTGIEIMRALFIWLTIIVSSICASTLIIVLLPIVYLFDRKRDSLHFIANAWAHSIRIFCPWWKFNVSGQHNLAKKGEAAVYVANHQSQADILALFILNTRFRWLAKKSLFKIPIFGWGMAAIGYVPVARGNKKSSEQCMRQCSHHLAQNTPMAFFPEGTRTRDGTLGPFKAGAFRLACAHGVPIIPITINGCSQMLPKGSLIPRAAQISVVVHPPISSQGLSPDALMKKTRAVIDSSLHALEDLKTSSQHKVSL